jgi:DNA polymerase III delta prime subunit
MGIILQSLPRRSSQLVNKGASALVKFFEADADVLYLYGPAGSGKSYALEMLAREYGYEILRTRPPFTDDIVGMLSSTLIFMQHRKLVLIDIGADLSANDIKTLSRAGWGTAKLVIVGEDFPKTSPIRTNFGNKDYKFVSVKFLPFEKNDVAGCLSLYALELGVSLSYEIINKIAEYADGDMRAARNSLKTLIASGDEDAVETFLPLGESVLRSDIAKLFSANEVKIREAIEALSPYLTMLIMRENILKFLPDDMLALKLLHEYANLDVEATDRLVGLATYLGKKIKTFAYVYYRNAKMAQVPEVFVDCSDGKKILYFSGFAELMKND